MKKETIKEETEYIFEYLYVNNLNSEKWLFEVKSSSLIGAELEIKKLFNLSNDTELDFRYKLQRVRINLSPRPQIPVLRARKKKVQ